MRRFVTVLLVLPGVAWAQEEKTWINRGVQAFRNAQYQEAIADFEKAASLSPNYATAHLYLGSAYMALWIPGANSLENSQNARAADVEFRRVLELEPQNITALSNLASLSFDEANALLGPQQAAQKKVKLDEARAFYQRILQVDPANQNAYYTLGVIAWMQVHLPLLEARASLGMRPEVAGPLTDPVLRQSLKSTYGLVIDEGILNLAAAIRINPQYDDAMAYMNLLIRQRADLRDTSTDYANDISTADQWLQQALDAKRAKVRPSAIAGAPPPPPPPPPPAPARLGTQPVRIGGTVERHLVRRVEPAYPPLARQARIEGSVRFSATIGTDGKVLQLDLVSGHPLLVPAAREAVQQWIYQPTLLNNEPVEVVTDVTINFTLPPTN
jgi:TonB family protein